MKNLSLKMKTIFMIFPAIIFLIIFGSILAYKEYSNKDKGNLLLARENAFATTSHLVHELQIERGKSGLYVGSKISKEEYSGQQEKVNNLTNELINSIASLHLAKVDEHKNKAGEFRNRAREAAEAKDIKEAVSNYTNAVSELIVLEKYALDEISFYGLEGRLRSLILFENSKEGMGRLRASLNPVFAGNLKKEVEDRDRYLGFINSIQVNLESPALQINEKTRESVNQILEGDGWKKILSDYKVFSQKYTVGDYGIDAKVFSDTITAQINAVNDQLKSEIELNINNLKSEVASANNTFILISTLVVVLILFVISFSVYTVRDLISNVTKISSQMDSSSENLRSVVGEIVSASESLSSAANEQAAAIQETSASLEEITSMINLGGEHVRKTTTLSENNLSSVDNGKTIIEKMVQSIELVANSNNVMSKEVETTNVELEKIIQVINELGSKIKVINDIVFQTKLLSFNASVEAARAGEQGKGFSVVAEEVGNLAQMSGQSAQEITGMLDHSMKTVNSIIENTKNKMSIIISDSQAAINESVSIAGQCREVFDEIRGSSQDISSMATEISSASKEQTSGVNEVNKAVAQLDQATQTIAKDAQGVVAISSNVNTQSAEIKNLAENLKEIIDGKS